MRTTIRLILIVCVALLGTATMFAQTTTYEGQPAVVLGNDKLQLTVLTQGGALASVVLADDPQQLNPYWNSARLNREAGRPPATGPFSGQMGHFLAVDGFGQPSADERKLGFPQHGEAHTLQFDHTSSNEAGVATLDMKVLLPIVQENFRRTFRIVKGENVVYVDSQLENLMGFDRPVNWAEHATIQNPFMEPGVTSVYLSGTRSQVRDNAAPQGQLAAQAAAGQGRGGQAPGAQAPGVQPAGAAPAAGRGGARRNLAVGKDFTWPMAPGEDGTPVDMSLTPLDPRPTNNTATLMTNQKLAWIAALNPNKRMIYGYIFKSDEYPWVQHWCNFSSVASLVRGMEFSTQPYDYSKREVLTKGPMFDTPTYRWLPAKSTIESHFLMFYAHVPEGFSRVDDIRLENGQITILDKKSGKQAVLAASRGL